MSKYFIFLFFLFPVVLGAQRTLIADDAEIKDSLELAGTWISGIQADTGFWASTHSTLPTSKAIFDWLIAQLASAGGGTLDTFAILSDTLYVSITDDDEPAKWVDLLPYKQSLTFDTLTGEISISSGNTINLDGLFAKGSGSAGTIPMWVAWDSLGNSAITQSGQEIEMGLTGSLTVPSGTDAQVPIWGAGKLRYNTTTGGFQGGANGYYIPYSSAPSFTLGSVLFSDGNQIVHDNGGLYFDATSNELRINTSTDYGSEVLQVNGNAVFGTNGGNRLVISGTGAKISAPIWDDVLILSANGPDGEALVNINGTGKVEIRAHDNSAGDGIYFQNESGGNEIYWDLRTNQARFSGSWTMRGETSNNLFLQGGDAYCTGCSSPGPRGYDLYLRGGQGNNLANRRGFGGDVWIQVLDSTASANTLMQFIPDNNTILTPNVIEPNTGFDWVYVMDADSMRKVTPVELVSAGSFIGTISTSTDGSGDITVAHGMGVTPTSVQVTVTGTTPYVVTVHSIDATNFTVRFYDMTGAAVTSTAVTATWHAKT